MDTELELASALQAARAPQTAPARTRCALSSLQKALHDACTSLERRPGPPEQQASQVARELRALSVELDVELDKLGLDRAA